MYYVFVSAISRIGKEVRKYRRTSGRLGETVRKLVKKWCSVLDEYVAEIVANNEESGLIHEANATFQKDLEEIDESVVGYTFCSEEKAIEMLDNWAYENKTSLVKATKSKEKQKKNGKTEAAYRVFKCPHSCNRKSRGQGKRPKQAVNYTGCGFHIRVVAQETGEWVVTSYHPDHSGHGHETSQENYFMHQNNRKLSPEDMQFVKDILLGHASNSNMASALSQRTGVHYSYLDVFNLVKRISDEEVVESIESHLSSIRSSGGTVNYKKKDGTNDVYILFIQTTSMKDHLLECKPNTFEMDTTFSTNKGHFKLWVPVYKSEVTNKWEIAGLLWIETECKEMVEGGIRMFKDSLP